MKLPSSLAAQGSFRRQIILTFVVGFFLLVTAFTVYQFRSERAFLYRESTNETISLAESLAASSRSWVLANDVAGLQEVVHAIEAHPELRYAMIISPSGQLLAHSDATKVGQYVSDVQSLALLKSPPVNKIMIDDETMSDIAVPIMVDQRFVGWARLGQARLVIAANLHKMMLSSILFVLLSVVLVLFAALLIANRLGYRIGRLMQVAEEVQSGNYSTRANIPGDDEVAKLAISLNHMLDVLARDEQQLRKASIYTRSLIEASLDPMVTISPEGKITDVNKATEEVTGRVRSELIATDFSNYFTEPDKARQGYQQVFLKGAVTDYPLALCHSDGHATDVLYNASIFRDGAGEVLGVFAVARDITESKRADAARTQLAAIVEFSNDAIVGQTPEGTITSWNKGAERIYGYGAAEIIGNPITILALPARHAEVRELLEKVRQGGTVTNYESERIRKDGARINVALTLSAIRDASGNITGISTIARDITERKQAEEQLRRSEFGLTEAQRIAHLGSWHMDLSTNEVYWSEELYKIYGFDPALPPPLYTESMKLFTAESWERLSTSITRAVEAGIPYELELETVNREGGRGWMLARGELERDASGAAVGVRGVVMDITTRKRDEEGLQRLNRELRAVSNCNETLMRAENEQTLLDDICRIVCDDAGYRMAWVGYPETDEARTIRPASWAGVEDGYLEKAKLTWADTERGRGPSGAAIRSGKSISIQDFDTDPVAAPWRDAALQRGYRSCISLPLKDESENTFGVLTIYSTEPNAFAPEEIRLLEELAGDMAFGIMVLRARIERERAEEDLRQMNERYSLSTRAARLGVWDWNLQKNELLWDDRMYELYGVKRDDFAGAYEAWLKGIHPDDREASDEVSRQAQHGEREYDTEFRVVWPDGSVHYLKAYGQFVRDTEGNALRMTGVNFDITERKRMESLLSQREYEYRTLADNSPDVIVRYDTGGRRIYVNPEFERVNHLRAQDVLGKTPAELSTELKPMVDEFTKRLMAAMESGTVDKVDLTWVKDGKQIFWFVRVVPEFDSNGKVVSALTIWSDITDRKLAEQQLRELNNDFVTLLENSGDFIYFKDKDGRLRFCSQTMADITGHHSWRDMIGKHDLEIFPEDTARIYYEEELPIFREGKPLLNKTNPYHDGQGKTGWVNTNKWPVFGDDKKTVVGIFGISRDVTELKEAEEEIKALNRDLEQRVNERTAQLEAANNELEAFSYSVSHDLRTPLRAIDGFSHILLDDYADKLDDEGKRLLKVVRDNTCRMGQLIDDILKFSRAGRVEIAVSQIDMEKLAREVVEELEHVAAGGNLQIEIDPVPPISCDRAMMRQVFINLLSNAIKFSRNRAPAIVKVGGYIQDDEAVYYVRDNGVGFDMQYVGKLFGVFQRLHSVNEFEGTGIGLAIVKRIISRHGGRVWAEGKIGSGATIYFALPTKEASHG